MKDGWNVRDASCTYKKISENSASLRVDFGLDLGLEQMLKHSYVMDLRFPPNPAATSLPSIAGNTTG